MTGKPAAKHAPITLDALPLSELVQWLNDNQLPDARTFLLPGTIAAAATSGAGGAITPNTLSIGAQSSRGLNNDSAFVQLGLSDEVTASNQGQWWLALASVVCEANSGNWTPIGSIVQLIANGTATNGQEANTYHNTAAATSDATASSLTPIGWFYVPPSATVQLAVYARSTNGPFGAFANLLQAVAFRVV